MKYFISLLVAFFFVGCAVNKPYLQKGKDTITLNIQNEVITINRMNNYHREGGGPLFDSIFFTNENLSLEYIQLKSTYTWTGLAEGFYYDFLRNNIKGLEKSETYTIKNGDIYKLSTKKHYFYWISLYSGENQLFLLDYNGETTSKILKKNLLIKQQNQIEKKIEKRFLKNYQFKNYFEKNSSDEPIIIPQS